MESQGYPWVLASVVALPGVALAAVGGWIGLDKPLGIVLALTGCIYLVVDVFVLQPRREAAEQANLRADRAVREFLERTVGLHTVDAVVREFGRAITLTLGDTRSVLLAPSEEGEFRVLLGSGSPPGEYREDPTPAFLWLSDCAEPLSRAHLRDMQQFEGARVALGLSDAFQCDVLLPLLHRGLLLGLGLVETTDRLGQATWGFLGAMRAHTTVALANTFLDAETRGRSQLARTFDLANAMQGSLMPEDRPVHGDGFELRGLFRPVAECGGDLWAWHVLEDGRICLLVADATGHGVAPALLAAVAQGTIDAHCQLARRDMEPGQLLAQLNGAIYRAGCQRYMMTAFAAIVDLSAGTLSFANAGQNFPYFIDATRGTVEPLIARGNSLGAVANTSFETHVVPMKRGDKLILYTDGVTEAAGPSAESWGERRFRAVLGAHRGESAVQLLDVVHAELERYLEGCQVSDDMTMVAFEYGNRNRSR